MIADMKSRMSLLVTGLSRLSSKEGRATILIGDMDISRWMDYVQQVQEEKLRDREEFKNKGAKIGNQSGTLLHHLLVHNNQNYRAKPSYSQGIVAQWGSKPPTCAKCGSNHSGICREGSIGCFKCGQTGHFMRECQKNK
uniref:Gag-pol protein n=1 Tax=Solanum tuberosum TaxID=4113 RepID=M1D8M1_SOLTU